MDKVARHKDICDTLNRIYAAKNHDYGDSFGQSFEEWGITAALVRISDKWNRIKSLTQKSNNALVLDEAVEDTILDMCNYLIMTYIELTKSKDNEGENERT